jgi:hypothetical protein
MKKVIILCIMAFGLSLTKADAQYVRRKPGFSIGISIGNRPPAPYQGAVWIGPEWTWRNGRYVEVAGHWARPHKGYRTWREGHWRSTRRGYRYYPGHWQ